jgi:hypothetical protein
MFITEPAERTVTITCACEGETDRMAREIAEFKESLFRVECDIFALKQMRKNLRGEIESRRAQLRQHLHLDA